MSVGFLDRDLATTPRDQIPEAVLNRLDELLQHKRSKSAATPTPKPNVWGQLINGEKCYPLHPKQREIFFSDARFTAAVAGTGGGKTCVGPLWISRIIKRIRETDPQRPIIGMIVAPTYKILSRATVPTLIDTFQGTELEGIYKETRNIFECKKHNIRIHCQGADNPNGLEGGQFSFVWMDEAGQMKLSAWIALQGRTGLFQAPILITTTPYSNNWLYHEVYKRYLDGNSDYFVRQWSSKDNPSYSEDEYARAKSSMTPERGAARYDGQFTGMSGLVYPDFYLCKEEMEVDDLIDRPGRFYGGIDLGWNDPFAAVCGLLDDDDILTVWFERYKSETMIEVHAEKLPKFKDRTIKWYCDHQPEYIRKLRKGGHKILKATKSIQLGIDAVNARIMTGRLKILYNRCPALFGESELYSYKVDNDTEETIGEKPVGCDHAMDALRYMIVGIDVKRAA